MDQLIRWADTSALLVARGFIPTLIVWGVIAAVRGRTMARRAAIVSAAIDAALVLSLAGIAVIGLRPGFSTLPGSIQWNLLPFRDVLSSLDGPTFFLQIALTNLLGNVLFFMPFGFMLALRRPQLGWLRALVVAGVVSLTIETAQAMLAIGRQSDITDVLMNTLGGGIGFWFGLAIRKLDLWRRTRLADPPDAVVH